MMNSPVLQAAVRTVAVRDGRLILMTNPMNIIEVLRERLVIVFVRVCL